MASGLRSALGPSSTIDPNRLKVQGNVVPVATKVLLTLRRHQYRRSVTENKTNVKNYNSSSRRGARNTYAEDIGA